VSQLILDDQLDVTEILPPISKWITARRLQDLRPGELIRDERVPEILMTLKAPTFITIDRGFWDSRLCHPKYCIVYFDLRDDQQELIPGLLRGLLRRAEFRSRSNRMGKVCHISTKAIAYWQFKRSGLKTISWTTQRRGK
jgi:hypothetical protein